MRVGAEGIPLFGNRTGIGQYEKRLLETASKMSTDIDYEVLRQLMPHRRITELPIPPNRHLKYHIVRWLPPIIYFQLYKRLGWTFPYEWVIHRDYDALLFFNFVAYPTHKHTKVAVVIHDLSYIYHKQYVSPKNQVYLERFVPKTLKRADEIITISENSKQEIMEHYHVPEEKITIINPSIDHADYKPRSMGEIKQVTQKYGITKPYIFSLCTLEPRKNLTTVLNAFDGLSEEIKQRYALVLGGGKGWLDGELLARFDELAERYTVIRTGYVADEDLPALYSGAALFVFVPFYEGFGMPLLEAMACGAPVISADNSSLPEVVGNAGIMIKAEDTPALTREIKRVLADQKLAAELRKKGIEQAAKFSWKISAKRLADLLHRMV